MELKKCKLCGGDARWRSHDLSIWIECSNCGYLNKTWEYPDCILDRWGMEQAVEEWNALQTSIEG